MFLVVMASCGPMDKTAAIPNGIYLILHEEASFTNQHGLTVPFSTDFLEGNEEGQPTDLVIDTSEFVPLDLKHEPEGLVQPDKRIHLLLTLSDIATEDLAEFTGKHLGRHIAIVIGGKAVTMHKVRSKIDSGKLQITRCTDNACEHLLVELKKGFDN